MTDGIGAYHKDFSVLTLRTYHVGDLNKLGLRSRAHGMNDGYINIGRRRFAKVVYEVSLGTADTFEDLRGLEKTWDDKIKETKCLSAKTSIKYICVD